VACRSAASVGEQVRDDVVIARTCCTRTGFALRFVPKSGGIIEVSRTAGEDQSESETEERKRSIRAVHADKGITNSNARTRRRTLPLFRSGACGVEGQRRTCPKDALRWRIGYKK